MKDHEFRPKPLLTNVRKEVFDLLVQDMTTKEIAHQLFISEDRFVITFKCNVV
ncbi:hypothetical protein KHA80_16745 [Anaerobacillus sp. HL2]|nr:hypothetical protein KHA80_16745 [Anaerobacillus sp. HL2]